MTPEQISNPGDVFKHLGDMMKPDTSKRYDLSNFFTVINDAHKTMQDMIKPFTCEVCGKHHSECNCESTC